MSMTMIPSDALVLDVNGWRFDALAVGPAQGELVLCLHGFPQFANAWLPIMQRLAGAERRAVAVDQRGYSPGARPVDVGAYTAATLVSDALGFLDALGAPSCHLVAHDWGGYLAWKLAAEHPERVRSLSVLSMPHPSAFLDSLARDADQQARSAYIDFFRAPDQLAEREMLRDDARRLRAAYRGRLDQQMIDDNVRRLSQDGALSAALSWYRALDFSARVGRIAVPTLFIWGSADHALGEAAARASAGFVDAPYRFEVLDGLSHWLLDEAADRCAHLLLEHIDGVTAAAARG